MPPRRRTALPLVIGLAAGAVVLLILAVTIVVLVASDDSSGHTARRGTLQLLPVLATAPSGCPAGQSGWVPSQRTADCYRLGAGMTVTQVKDVGLRPPDPASGSMGYAVNIRLGSQDAARLATLTGQIAREQAPKNQLAIVVGGKVASAPAVIEPITGGTLMLAGKFTRKDAQQYVDLFR